MSVALIAGGVNLRFVASNLLSYLGNIEAVEERLRQVANVPDISLVTYLPLLRDICNFFVVIGCCLCALSSLACCGALCRLRLLLIVVTDCVLIVCSRHLVTEKNTD